MENLRAKVLSLVDEMKGQKGATSEIGRAAESEDWGKLLDLWQSLGDENAIAALCRDRALEIEEEVK